MAETSARPCRRWVICRHSASLTGCPRYPLKADTGVTHRHVRLGPGGDITRLFNHLVGGRKQRRRNLDSERFGGLEIDEQIELCRLLEGNIAGSGAVENLLQQARRAVKALLLIAPITVETAGPCK